MAAPTSSTRRIGASRLGRAKLGEAADIGGFLSSTYRIARSLTSATGRSVVWTRLVHPALHQTATTTAPDRYPELFAAMAARLPDDANILSFGCSTGEELLSLRRMLPTARLTGVEINPRARSIATSRIKSDPLAHVTATLPDGPFDAILALAVLQREPHRVEDEGITDLSRHYPFERFDEALSSLVERLVDGGLLAVINAHYRVEDSSAAPVLEPITGTPLLDPPLFNRHSRRYDPAPASASLFRKCAAISSPSTNNASSDQVRATR